MPTADLSNRAPTLEIRWDATKVGITGTELVQKLDQGSPRILVLGGQGRRPDMMASSIGIMPYMMQPGDYKIVADTLSKYLQNPGRFDNPPVYTGTTANLAGTWNVTINYVRGVGDQQFILQQDGTTLSCEQKGEIFNATLHGKVDADHARLTSVMETNGYQVPFVFTGVVSGNKFRRCQNGRVRRRNIHSHKSIGDDARRVIPFPALFSTGLHLHRFKVTSHKRFFMAVRYLYRTILSCAVLFSTAAVAQEGGRTRTLPPNPLPYDLLLKGGHVLDDKNHIDATRDVGIKDGKIAAVAEHLDQKDALKTIDVNGLYVAPGLIDLHTHVYTGTGERGSYAGDLSVYPDGFTLRNGVTTIVDAGSSGWRNFDDFKDKIIDRSRTRVLSELNIVGAGMRGGKYEDNLDDMDGKLTGDKAKQFPGVIVGIKSAHFTGPEWKPYDQAVIAGNIANIPVMIDYGARRIERPLLELVSTHLRPGDIYTHCFSGLRGEQNPETGLASEALLIMKKRGIYCDVGHGGGSFAWTVAAPIVKAGYLPDSISTDLHVGSMNNGMKDILNVADKLMVLGETIPEVVAQMTSHPAHEIKQEQLGNLSVGSGADVAVLSAETGNFGFVDMYNTKMMGTKKLVCELTLRDGKVVYDLNGISADMWDATLHSADERQSARWTTFNERPFGASHGQRFPVSAPAGQPPPAPPK